MTIPKDFFDPGPTVKHIVWACIAELRANGYAIDCELRKV